MGRFWLVGSLICFSMRKPKHGPNNLKMRSDLLYMIDTPRAFAILCPVIWGRGGLDAGWRSHDYILTRLEFGTQVTPPIYMFRKKGQAQVSIYLFCQSNEDSIPAASIPSQSQDIKDGFPRAHSQKLCPSSTPFTTVRHTRPDSPLLPSSTFNLNLIPSTSIPRHTRHIVIQGRRYQRISPSAVQASATGTSQTRFSAGGWKSSALQPKNL